MFHWKCVDEGENPVGNPNIYNIEGDNSLSSSLQPLTTRNAITLEKQRRRICIQKYDMINCK